MTRYFLFGILFSILVSCKKNISDVQKTNTTKLQISNGFVLKGHLENFYPKKVYLNKIIEQHLYQIDSSNTLDNTFIFIGTVDFPERYALTFENYSSIALVILENAQFEVHVNGNSISDPIVKGSILNTKLNEYKTKAKGIFKEIDLLFPYFQKARLENDVEKLQNIELKMNKIEQTFTQFSNDFIVQNRNSFVAPMVLRDQLKSSRIDTLQIKRSYEILSTEVKNSPDSQIINSFLNLH